MIKVWVAPTVTAIIAALIVAFVTVLIKKRNAVGYINTISAAEEKLLEILRPFFIQELELTQEVLIDLRRAIIKEYKLKDEKFISIKEIKEAIILDILRTRFIKEDDKKRLVESTYITFGKYKESITEEKNKLMYEDELKVNNYNHLMTTLALIITMLSAITTILLKSNSSGGNELGNYLFNNISNNVMIALPVVGIIFFIVSIISILVRELKEDNEKNKITYTINNHSETTKKNKK
ncbi:hypothetical protein [Clostridium sp. YIM B02569]|uniref:hypothetical protein n=1 Tax=Clostridium sp. YIM B02569 TaxID=2911967 RepID=UPI001EED24A7|nr:hypothetical protein [Clostridium sp. YIM B02569]